MTEFRTVRKNGKKRVVPVTGRKVAIERKASPRDMMRWPPEKKSNRGRLQP